MAKIVKKDDIFATASSIDWVKPIYPSYTYSRPSYTYSRDDLNAIFGINNIVKSEDKGEEEWVWVTGYKGTNKDMKCRDYQFELGKQFDMPEGEEIKMCHSGFHFCDKLKDVYNFYDVLDGHRFFEVKALVRRWKKDNTYTIEQQHDKMVAKSIMFVRELTIDEIFDQLTHDSDTKNWTAEQKEQARQTNIYTVRESIKVNHLVELGYSEAFASFVVRKGAYDIAVTMAKTPNVSMDVKVLTIAMEIYE